MGRLRRVVPTGYELYNYFYNLAMCKYSFTPPLIFKAMRLVPPIQGPFHADSPGKIVLPDDNLRAKMEKKSEHAQRLFKHGFVALPWWFETRAIDEALKEVKDLMKENPKITEDEAIEMWNQKMERRERIRQREIQLSQEEAQNRRNSATQQGGQSHTLSIEDSENILKLLQDMYRESDTTVELSPDDIINQVKLYNDSKSIELPSYLQEEQAEMFKHHLNYVIRYKMKHYEKVEGKKKSTAVFYTEDVLKSYALEIEKRLHPTYFKKMATAIKLFQLLSEIIMIKCEKLGKENVSNEIDNDEELCFHLLDVFSKSFNIQKSQNSAIDEYLNQHYEAFLSLFTNFVSMKVMKINVSGYLSKLDLGFEPEHKPFKDNGPYPLPLEDLVSTVDISKTIQNFIQQKPKLNKDAFMLYVSDIKEFWHMIKMVPFVRREFITPYLDAIDRANEKQIAMEKQEKEAIRNENFLKLQNFDEYNFDYKSLKLDDKARSMMMNLKHKY